MNKAERLVFVGGEGQPIPEDFSGLVVTEAIANGYPMTIEDLLEDVVPELKWIRATRSEARFIKSLNGREFKDEKDMRGGARLQQELNNHGLGMDSVEDPLMPERDEIEPWLKQSFLINRKSGDGVVGYMLVATITPKVS